MVLILAAIVSILILLMFRNILSIGVIVGIIGTILFIALIIILIQSYNDRDWTRSLFFRDKITLYNEINNLLYERRFYYVNKY